MTVVLSPMGGVATQFFNNNGVPLSGGKIYTYEAGTTTPATTYTSSSGTFALYDSATASTSDPKIANTVTVTAGTQYISFPPGIWFSKGLYIDIANTIEYTVVYE